MNSRRHAPISVNLGVTGPMGLMRFFLLAKVIGSLLMAAECPCRGHQGPLVEVNRNGFEIRVPSPHCGLFGAAELVDDR